MRIRPVRPEDAPALLDIYAPYILATAVTFEVAPPSAGEFAQRIAGITARFPYLAVEGENGRLAGFAYAHPAAERAAYQWNAELSVYLRGDSCGRGLGSRLYAALIGLLGPLGYRNLYALITLPNPASLALHARMGFRTLAVQRRAGYKLGRWHDVAWLEKPLGPYGAEPRPPLSVKELAPELFRRVLERA